MRTARNALLALFNNPSASPDKMEEASNLYFSLVQGLFHVPETNKTDQSSTSKSTEEDGKEKKDKSGY